MIHDIGRQWTSWRRSQGASSCLPLLVQHTLHAKYTNIYVRSADPCHSRFHTQNHAPPTMPLHLRKLALRGPGDGRRAEACGGIIAIVAIIATTAIIATIAIIFDREE